MKLIRELKFMKKKESYTKSRNIKDEINNSKKFAEGLKKIIAGIENNKIRTKKSSFTKSDSSVGSGSSIGSDFINLSWMNNSKVYKDINQDITNRYNKDNDSFELLSLKSFIDNINDKYIKNKKDAMDKFKTVKKMLKVMS